MDAEPLLSVARARGFVASLNAGQGNDVHVIPQTLEPIFQSSRLDTARLMNSSNHLSRNGKRRLSKRQLFRLWLLGTTIGVLISRLVLYTFFGAEPSARWIALLIGVWIGAAIIYFWQVRGKE